MAISQRQCKESFMKRTTSTALVAAFIALFAVKVSLLRAQTPPAEYLPMGTVTELEVQTFILENTIGEAPGSLK